MFAVAIDHSEFHIAVERSAIYCLPVHVVFIHPQIVFSDGRETGDISRDGSALR